MNKKLQEFIIPDDDADEIISRVNANIIAGRKKPSKKRKQQRLEDTLQEKVVKYITRTYPDVMFRADTTAGMKLTIGQAMKAKRLGGNTKDWPDLMIMEPKKHHHGLFIELKKEGTKLYKKDGVTFRDDHIKCQNDTLEALNQKGYVAKFACGFEEARAIIDEYMSYY